MRLERADPAALAEREKRAEPTLAVALGIGRRRAGAHDPLHPRQLQLLTRRHPGKHPLPPVPVGEVIEDRAIRRGHFTTRSASEGRSLSFTVPTTVGGGLTGSILSS